ncbi:MAG: T9SS type A sorting domain-containing protein [Flavobacteriales bacterium]|nr:T9SS type A sorting domain-containing protein [Flavobacteriales bacterium]
MKRALPALLLIGAAIDLAAQAPLTALLNVQHATCGTTTGGITASVWGGSPPYTFVWSPTPPSGNGTSSFQGAPAGTYQLTVTDAISTELIVEGTIIETPDLFPPIGPATAWSCNPGCEGTFYQYVSLNGSTMPYTVDFNPPGPGGGASPNGLYFNTLCIGETYTVTVSDVNGCTGTVTGLEVIGPMAPELLSSEVTGSCPGGSTGSMTLLFNQMDSVIVTGPNGMLVLESTNPFIAGNLAPGMYTINAWYGGTANPPGTSNPWCSSTLQVEIPLSSDPCGLVSGMVYADLDGDCTQDAGEPGLPYRIITIEQGGHLVLTAADGSYGTELFYGDYELDEAIPSYDVICPTLPAGFTLDAVTPTAVIDLAMDPLEGPDVRTHLVAGVHRPGFPVTYTVSVQNNGPYSFSDLTLDLVYDPILVFGSAEGSPAVIGPAHLQWSIASLPAFSWATYVVHLSVPPNAGLIGTVVSATATVTPTVPDSDPANDSYVISRTIVGAYDPNDKLAQTSSRASEAHYFLDLDSHIDYTIRFQNTGTAEAINVHLVDTISPLLDLFSLEILGASHPFQAELQPGRVLRFDFPNINLPDSTSDLIGSQGFASFRLKPVGGLAIGELLENVADIYFDFNEPIRTNTSVLMTEFSVGVPEALEGLALHPNPARDQLVAHLPAGVQSISVLSADGRMVLQRSVRDAVLRLDISGLMEGAYILRAASANGMIQHHRFVKH